MKKQQRGVHTHFEKRDSDTQRSSLYTANSKRIMKTIICKTINATCSNCNRILSTHSNIRDRLHTWIFDGKLRLRLFWWLYNHLDNIIWGDYKAAYYDCPKETEYIVNSHCYLCKPDEQRTIEIRFFNNKGILLS